MKNCFLILFRIAVDRGSIGNDVITVFNILFEEFLHSTLTYILGVCHLEQTDSFRSPLRKRDPLYQQSPAPSFPAILTSATRPITFLSADSPSGVGAVHSWTIPNLDALAAPEIASVN